jgi:dTDP-D-glucose 4,6-dehydratase
MKLLITGASTLLGSQVLSWFKQYYPEIQISTLEDLSDARVVTKLLQVENFDAVIHLGVCGQFGTTGTKLLLEVAKACWQGDNLIKRFLYVSSESIEANQALLRKYKDMSLIISSCRESFASSAFPRAFREIAEKNLTDNNTIPVYANGQEVPAWFWVNSQACAIDVLFHQGEAGLIYNIGGMNAWKSAGMEINHPLQGKAYMNEPALVKSYHSFMIKMKRIFFNLAADLNA